MRRTDRARAIRRSAASAPSPGLTVAVAEGRRPLEMVLTGWINSLARLTISHRRTPRSARPRATRTGTNAATMRGRRVTVRSRRSPIGDVADGDPGVARLQRAEIRRGDVEVITVATSGRAGDPRGDARGHV